jgi:hypothetical protein
VVDMAASVPRDTTCRHAGRLRAMGALLAPGSWLDAAAGRAEFT